MSLLDRRSGRERRVRARYKVNIEIEWQGRVGRKDGTMSDISELGCFILSSGEVENNEVVKVFFPLSDGRKIEFKGEVVNHVYEIGFAMRFVALSPAQSNFLGKIVEKLKK